MENFMLPDTATSTCSPVAVSGATLSLLTSVSYNDRRTPDAGPRNDRMRQVPATRNTTTNYIAANDIAGHGAFGLVGTDVSTVVEPAANVAALAKQGAPPRGEPR